MSEPAGCPNDPHLHQSAPPTRASVSSTVCKLKVGAADDFQYVGGGRLLLQRLPQLIEQPRVLDGDNGLGGEVFHEFNLLVGKRPDFLPEDADNSDQRIVLEHRHTDEGSRTCQPDEELRVLWVFLVSGVFGHISGLDRSFGPCDLCDYRRAGHAHQWFALSRLDIRGRCVVHRHGVISITLAQEQHAEIGLAEASCIFQDGRENRR